MPVSALPGYCRGLDLLTDADIRVPQQWSIGPSDMLLAGGHVAMVQPAGIALKILNANGECRGVFASWAASCSAVYGLVAEWETSADLSAAASSG